MKKRIAIGTGIFLLVLVGLLAGGSIYMINFHSALKTEEKIWKALSLLCEKNIRKLSHG